MHNLITHFPFSKDCENCRESKPQHAPHKSADKRADQHLRHVKAEKFGDHITADHAIMGIGEKGRQGQQVALIIQDEATGWIQAYPSTSKDADSVSVSISKVSSICVSDKSICGAVTEGNNDS